MIGSFLKGAAKDFRRLALESCESTNSECLELARNGEPGNVWITSRQQTGGKGSRGRNWQSVKGNLYASLLLRTTCDQAQLGGLTFVAGLSVLGAIQGIRPDLTPQLKWPNDLLVNSRKCGGILLESSSAGGQSVVVIGLGINCVSHPASTVFPATNLEYEGAGIEPDTLFSALAAATAEHLEIWDEGRNFTEIRDRWLRHAAGIGEEITVKIPGRDDICGIFSTVDDAGYIMLKKANGESLRISVADIFFNSSNPNPN